MDQGASCGSGRNSRSDFYVLLIFMSKNDSILNWCFASATYNSSSSTLSSTLSFSQTWLEISFFSHHVLKDTYFNCTFNTWCVRKKRNFHKQFAKFDWNSLNQTCLFRQKRKRVSETLRTCCFKFCFVVRWDIIV